MTPTPAPLIGPEQAALIARRVSVIVGSRDAAQRPHVMRAVGRRVSDDLRQVTVFLPAAQSRAMLADLRANGQIAVVFSEPSTNRTVQLKGGDARITPLAADDPPHIERYLRDFADEIGQLGFTQDVADTLVVRRMDELVAVHFTPLAAFEQTPGPNAGRALNNPGG